MQFPCQHLFLKHCCPLFLLLHFHIYVAVINAFFVKNCNIKSSLTNPGNLKAICSKRTIHSVPENLPYQLRVLDISQNQISMIKNNDLVHLSSLTNLNISSNTLQDIEEGAFRSLVDLQDLNLANNRLTTISEQLFRNLVNLTVLRLEENYIRNIHVSTFKPLRSLVIVNLSRNHLHSIQELQPVFTLPNIRNLYLRSNRLTSFQTCEVSNTSLNVKVLDLSLNPLNIFRITADVFPHLEMLDLAFINRSMKWDVQDKKYLQNVNRLNLSGIQMTTEEIAEVLQTFNNSLANLRLYNLGEIRVNPLAKIACLINSLIVLRLEQNHLSYISEKELTFCKHLTILDLANNNLADISELTFVSMDKLTSLLLSHNNLKNVPVAIRNLHTLEILDLSYNAITMLTCSDFTNLTKLVQLHIYRNPLSFIEHRAFQNLNNLKTIIIGSNIITLKGYFQTGLQKLVTLDLARNKLNSVHTGDFQCLQSLKYLYLQDNQIQYIEAGAFEGLIDLIELNLQSNKITRDSIKASVFSGLPKLQHLVLNNNYISYSSQKRLDGPPFASLTSLDSLSIHSQAIGNIPLNFLEGLKSLNAFFVGRVNINSLHSDTFSYTPSLRYLDLSKNELVSISPKIFLPVKKLYRLVMIKTGLQSLDFVVQANLTELHFLFLRQNAVSVINKTVTDSLSKLIYLDLEQNGFSCDCTNAWFINWTVNNKETQVLNADHFKCLYPLNLRGSKVLDLDLNSCSVDMGYFFFVSTTAVVLLTLLISFFYHFLKWQVVYGYYLFLAFVYDKKQKKKQRLQGFQYDAFISYNTHDELWVVRELLPQLEGEQGWRLCLHHRDFQPGKPIIDNIVDGIYSSRKTICVISRHYLESEWCSREIQVASFRLFDEKKDVLILVLLEDIPAHQLSPYYRMRNLIKKRTYLNWPKSGQDTHVFWQKLKVALET